MRKQIRLLVFGMAILSTTCGCSVSIAPPAALAATAAPLSLASLGLRGRLVYQRSTQNGSAISMSIEMLDLATAQSTVVFQAPVGGWINSMSVSPDGQELVMAYVAPPADTNAAEAPPQDLYVLPIDGSAEPKLLFTPPPGRYHYLEPTWAPDGKYLYFCRLDYRFANLLLGRMGSYEIYRMSYPRGEPERVAENAYWPRLSPDGTRLAYVATDAADKSNQLWISQPNGSGATPVPLQGSFVSSVIDAPLFSGDGKKILYSGTIPTFPAQPGFGDKLLGITVASAHAIPSDWWSVSEAGGQPARLTRLAAQGLYGSLSPDGKLVVSYSNNGIFVMAPDGTSVTTIVSDIGGIPGTVNWLP